MPQKNFIFLGEAGCGKSEIAMNFAIRLAKDGRKIVFFDLDMTKPLFRSRDEKEKLQSFGVELRYEEQFADAPVTVGGLSAALRDSGTYTVADVGGDSLGALAIGRYAPLLEHGDTAVFYTINPYRAWSDTAEHIYLVMEETLAAARLPFSKLHFIANPNYGKDTAKDDVLNGLKRLKNLLQDKVTFTFVSCPEDIAPDVSREQTHPVFPIRTLIRY